FNMSPLRGFTCYGYIFYYKHVAPIGAWFVTIRNSGFVIRYDHFAMREVNKIPHPSDWLAPAGQALYKRGNCLISSRLLILAIYYFFFIV
ncbi:MAG: hypothetical protein JXL67_06070, partial [Calditrichaeota bacterium]|nr:hypothetical protein [Calditrichota bacterium]